MKTGLVLEGGAMRGLFTAGVLDVLMERGIRFDGMIGVSAGATFGCNYKSGQIGRTLRYNLRYCRDPRYASVLSLILTGDLYGADFDYHRIPEELDPFDIDAFRENPMKFYCVCTDVETGRPVYPEVTDGRSDIDWIRASASMPVVSRPVEIEGKRYLDGGLADSVPLAWFEKAGYGRNLVVLTQPESYRKQPVSHMKLYRGFLRKYPKVADRIAGRHAVYNFTIRSIRQQEERGACLIIQPDEPLNIHHVCHDPKELQRVYDIGRRIGEGKADQVEAFLAAARAEAGQEDDLRRGANGLVAACAEADNRKESL